MTNSRQKMVTFNEGQLQKLKELMEHYSLMGISEAVRFTINMVHEDTFRYKRRQHTPQTAEEKAQKSIMTQTIKQQMKQENEDKQWRSIAEALNGQISEDSAGNKYCKWINYVLEGGKVVEYDQEVPVEHLSQILVDNQFDPNKEIIIQKLSNNKS